MSDTQARDDQTYKADVRKEWTTAASGWQKWFATLEAPRAGDALTAALLDQVGVRSGDKVLDVGTGYGEPGITAAAAVGSTGRVTCLDISGDMLAFAEIRAREADLRNVTFVEADIEDHSLDPGSYDVVLSRAALMYTTDPLSTLRRLHRALDAGGRLAVAVWATPDRVAFAVPVAVMLDMGVIDPPGSGPGPFALGADGVLEELVREAGFVDVAAGTTVVVYEAASAETCTQWVRDVAPPITDLIAHHPDAVQEHIWQQVTQAWAPFQDEHGTVRLPCTAIWSSGRVAR